MWTYYWKCKYVQYITMHVVPRKLYILDFLLILKHSHIERIFLVTRMWIMITLYLSSIFFFSQRLIMLMVVNNTFLCPLPSNKTSWFAMYCTVIMFKETQARYGSECSCRHRAPLLICRIVCQPLWVSLNVFEQSLIL